MIRLFFSIILFFSSSIFASLLDDNDAFSLQKYSEVLRNLSSSDPKNSKSFADQREKGGDGKRWPFEWHRHKINPKVEVGNSTSQKGETEFVDIRISRGSIRGTVSYDAGLDKPAYLFRGIPMAEPPVGKLRFQPLQEKQPWGKVLNATKYSPACLSNTTRTHSPQHFISEDCIYMNVFTSPKCMEKPCPVLFYVHGGGFVYDSATMFNDSQIVRKYASDGIVFLIPAYRLGVFGFFDLGNDRTVKRNLGMHDIIFALEWTRREVKAFGGDSDRVTVMGNSAGGSAVAYLCSSPAVTERHFQQAIISSGVPSFLNDTNLKPSLAFHRHLFSDWQMAECLRRVDSLDLLRQQQIIEEKSNLLFVGPETDTELLPAKNYVALLKHWKVPLRIIYVTTKDEYEGPASNKSFADKSAKLDSECTQRLLPMGYLSSAAHNVCVEQYSDTFYTEESMRVSYESMHAEAFLTALVNTRQTGRSYVGEFEVANYSNHANDMYFFIGLHQIPMDRFDLRLMDWYYPQMIKNFVKGKAPDIGWKPQNWNGRNYFRITFNVSDNGTLTDWPHGVDGYQDMAGIDFWLRELPLVEQNATRETEEEKEEEEEQTWQSVFVPRGWQGDGKRMERRNESINHSRLAMSALMAHGTFMAKPLPDETVGMPMDDEGTEGADEENGTSDNGKLALGGGELRRVWTAFWLALSAIVLLAIALLLLIVKRRRNYAYAYSSNNSTGDSEFCTEKSRIYVANDTNAMRYS
ncbi:hypothetical protein niasHS_005844 [Heterodera schachtii]|uniref:Carboxylesterase type B domain-containing protein n=1 Tax=Heterodera schachtii TaxID=97005 RepID=A0ABD2K000_HETSC